MNATEINQTYDLLALAEKDTNLKKTGGGWYTGPCPFCGGTDRFVVKNTKDGFRWFCRKCGNDKYHTSIDYVMRRESLDFKSALKSLGGETTRPKFSAPILRRPEKIALLPPEEWQREAWQEISAATSRLQTRGGIPAQIYLVERAIIDKNVIGLAWLGFSLVYDPKLKQKRPAIMIPHYDGNQSKVTINGIKYRFIDRAKDGLRYTAKHGSKFHLYGLWGLTTVKTLLLIEGEFNALSVKQITRSIDVLSIGSDGTTTAKTKMLEILAAKYQRVLIWTDEMENAKQLRTEINRQDAKCIKSPVRSGKKYDANQMLVDGLLSEFLTTIL